MITVFFTKFDSDALAVKRDIWYEVSEAHWWLLEDLQELLLVSVSE